MSEPFDQERWAKADTELDRALASYAGEPLGGFGRRAIEGVRLRQAGGSMFSGRQLLPGLAAAATIAATVAAALLFGIHIGEQRADSAWQQRMAKLAISTATTQAVASPRSPKTFSTFPRRRTGRTVALKPSSIRPARHSAQFPTPQRLTKQEQAIAGLARSGDPALLSSLVHPIFVTDDHLEESTLRPSNKNLVEEQER
jgi:hypothetical protein